MLDDSFTSDSDRASAESLPEPDGGMVRDLDQVALYSIIHAAVKDALLDVIGTLLLVAIAFVLVLAGAQVVLSSPTPLAPVIGLLLVVSGLYLAGTTLELIPSVRDLL